MQFFWSGSKYVGKILFLTSIVKTVVKAYLGFAEIVHYVNNGERSKMIIFGMIIDLK